MTQRMRAGKAARAARSARRGLLGMGVAAFGLAAAHPLRAEQPSGAAAARRTGPPVWVETDQAELDAACDQSKYAPRARLPG